MRIVDLGCGTGLLTRTLALPGRSVVGIDPSGTRLGWARRKPGAASATWIEGDAASITPTGDADLVVCTGNAIMHLDPSELAKGLIHIRDALRPGGVVSFESRNPSARAWEKWTKDLTRSERATNKMVPGGARAHTRCRLGMAFRSCRRSGRRSRWVDGHGALRHPAASGVE